MPSAEEQTFHQFFLNALERAPQRLALTADGQTYTYEDLWEKSGWLARALLKAGLAPGERVGLWLPNGAELILSYIALSRAGAIAIPINTRFRRDELGYLFNHSGLAMLFCPGTFLDTDFCELLREVAPDLASRPGGECATSNIPSLRRVLTASDTPPSGFCSFWNFLNEGRTFPGGPLDHSEKAVQPGDTYLLMYTSGSTSTPKGVLLKHASCARKALALTERLGLRNDDRFYTAMPITHAAGLFSGWWLAVAVSGPLFTHSRFSAKSALETLSREGITVERSFPTLVKDQLELLARGEGDYDISRLRTGLASSLSPDVFEKLADVIGPHEYVNNFGFTEATGVVTLSDPKDPPEVRWGKMGKPLEGMEVRIADPDSDESRPAGEEGEILVRGWAMMKGYHDPGPEVLPPFGPGGWYRSGDLGYLDRDGYLTYLGRVRERLRVGGENVSPEEISVFLRRHPEVEAAEVFGVPDGRLGEIPVAIIQRKPDAGFSEEDILNYCRRSIAGFKIPRHIRFVGKMPLNSSLKINRRKLRQDFLDELKHESAADD